MDFFVTALGPVLVLAAHPDDEVLGCGGTIAHFAAHGRDVHVVFATDGESSRGDAAGSVSARAKAAQQACVILGAKPPTFHLFPDNAMDSVPRLDITKMIEAEIARLSPEILLTHHAGDVNIDHRRLHDAVIPACRPQTGHPVKTLLFFEVPSSTEWQIPGTAPAFEPNWFQDITPYLEIKTRALQAYADELRAWPHPRSARAVDVLSQWRGATVGVEAAEAFMLGRKLQ